MGIRLGFYFSFLDLFPNVDWANDGNICSSILPPRQDKQLVIRNTPNMQGQPTGQRPVHCANILPYDF
jgi:hypothetical protein